MEQVQARGLSSIEMRTGVDWVAGVVVETRAYLSSSGSRLADNLWAHLSAYNAAFEVVPFFGDGRLAYTEAEYQLRNSVCLAFHGFYSQAFSTLRSVCELTLLQSSLSPGVPSSDIESNIALILGEHAGRGSEAFASSLEAWAVDGCKVPHWTKMRDMLLNSTTACRFNKETQFDVRLKEFFDSANSYVHERGYLRSATGLSNANYPSFSEKSLLSFGTRMMDATQLSLSMLLLAFLPTATTEEDAASGFIDNGQLAMAMRVLPAKDKVLLGSIRDERVAELSKRGFRP